MIHLLSNVQRRRRSGRHRAVGQVDYGILFWYQRDCDFDGNLVQPMGGFADVIRSGVSVGVGVDYDEGGHIE